MIQALPTAEVVREHIDELFDAHTPVWVLRWAKGPGPAERLWELPEGLCVIGAGPRRLGLRIRRESPDAYAVRLLWESTQLSWPALSRVELLASCLAPLLAALGMDLWSLLEQDLPRRHLRPRAA
jgi:hypothetical protein